VNAKLKFTGLPLRVDERATTRWTETKVYRAVGGIDEVEVKKLSEHLSAIEGALLHFYGYFKKTASR
jgi:hypothetical protein